MKYSFSQAKQKLASYAGAYESLDLDDAVNTAMEELSKSEIWNQQTQLASLTSYNEFFAIPQEWNHIIRAAINNTPVSIHRTDYEFLFSGPGNLDAVPAGYAPINGLQMLGTHFPTMYAPDRGVTLTAFSTEVPEGALIVRGKDANGDLVSVNVPINEWAGPTDIDNQDAAAVEATTLELYDITSVTMPQDVTKYVSLYGVSGDEFFFLSRMHPSIRIPEFTRYRLPGFCDTEGTSYDILCEVSRRFMPLVDDDDVVPFDSLFPIQYMMKSFQYLGSDEIEAGTKYHALAVQMLQAREAHDDTHQGLTVENPLYELTPGYASDYLYDNI